MSRETKSITYEKNLAEFIGTFWLVFGGCGSAMLAAAFPNVGIGLVGFHLFWFNGFNDCLFAGHISGAHLNPAVTIGLWAGGRVDPKTVLPYIILQVLGAIAAAGVTVHYCHRQWFFHR